MGLDQYIERKVVKKEEVFYWRKFGELQNLMQAIYVRECKDNENFDPEFNCRELPLTIPICNEVIKAIKSRNLPDHQGFFFGRSNVEDDEYLNDAVKKFTAIKQELKDNPTAELVYYAWY